MIEAWFDRARLARMDQECKRDVALLAIVWRCVALAALLMLAPMSGEAQPPVRQILLLQSFDRGNLILDHFTGNLRVDLDRSAGSPVNVVQIVVGPTGFVGASEQAIVDFIRFRLCRSSQSRILLCQLPVPRQLFAHKYRQSLFPDVPLLFAAVDQKYLQGVAPWRE